ncbi:MAG: DUF1566 domain-containing protein [Myxococcales bacterium]|nr:DUF1566 domain-containing protein [Myxococcales bacterium]
MRGRGQRDAANAWPAFGLLAALVSACGPNGESGTEAGADTGADPEADGDVGPDVATDAGPEGEAEAGADVEVDGGADVEPDSDDGGSTSRWAVPPTGQGACYDETAMLAECPGGTDPPSCGAPALRFCGQDAQYRDAERMLVCRSAAGDPVPCSTLPVVDPGEVVEDSLTGLVWQRAFAAGVPWAEAGDACASLGAGGLGGRTDWRLPTIYELATLIDLGRAGPAIDTAAFPGTPTMPGWWSATPDAVRSELAWGVGFQAGELNEGPVGMPAFVRCVAGPSFLGAEGPDRFDAAADPAGAVVSDRATGLAWQADVATGIRWAGALARCEELVLGGADDWRLPNVAELRSLVRVDLAGVKTSFPGAPADCFWSSTTNAGDPSAGWVVSFASGHVFPVSKTTTFSVRCVRGSP